MSSLTAYLVNCILTIAASEDSRIPALQGPTNLARASLASLRSLPDPLTLKQSSLYGDNIRGFAGVDKRSALLAVSFMDLAATLGMLATIFWLRGAIRKLDKRVDDARLTAADFTAVVYGLPAEALKATEIAAHVVAVLPTARVADVTVARAWGASWDALAAKGDAQEGLERLRATALATGKPAKEKAVAKLTKQLADANAKLVAFDESKMVCTCAFVMFESSSGRDAALAAFPGGFAFSVVHAMMGKRLHPRTSLFRGKHRLRMSVAPEPEDVLRENLHVSWAGRQGRQALIGIVTFCLLLVTVGFTIGARTYELKQRSVQCGAALNKTLACDSLWNLTATSGSGDCARVVVNNLANAQSAVRCGQYISAGGLWMQDWKAWVNTSVRTPQTCPPSNLLATAAGSPQVQCAAQVCQDCYCEAQTFGAWFSNKHDLGAFCKSFWSAYINEWALKGMTILSIIVINVVLSLCMPALTRFERLTSRSSADCALSHEPAQAAPRP